MKRLLFLLCWYVFANASEPTDKWIVFYENETTIHKCKREDYLEMMELLEGSEDEKYGKQYYNLMYNESIYFTELHRNKTIK